MRITDLIQRIDSDSLIEIIDIYTRRLYYGLVKEISIEVWQLLQGIDLIALNCSIIQTSDTEQSALIQLIV